MKSFQNNLDNGKILQIDFLKSNLARIRYIKNNEAHESGLNRYHFINENFSDKFEVSEKKNSFLHLKSDAMAISSDPDGNLTVIDKNGKILLEQISIAEDKKAVKVEFKAQKDEDWIGFGDQTRERIYHRGHIANCEVSNVASYVPVPAFFSTYGIGVLVNTTHNIIFDMCKKDVDIFKWLDYQREVDYYVFTGCNFKDLINTYTDLTGKPELPPLWAFGLWYLCRTQADDHEAITDALNFRREEIPCDVLGLEPGWMDTVYDLSIDKKWSKERFPIPSYCPNGPHNFLNAVKRMGYHFELWMANEYDLSYEEERNIENEIMFEENKCEELFHDSAEVDEHFAEPRLDDKITKPEEPWFEHLKKFVDQGVDFFKQDGAFQICVHPNRVWGNGMLDAEMHNLYPLLYSRQMKDGFENHTGKRSVVFTVAGWTGFQSVCSTWTGDTGGRLDTLGGMLNTSIMGHSWATNDMEVAEKEGVHFGYLQPWSQINSWTYFRMPWIQGAELLSMHKFYSRLRSQLIPYLYSWACESCKTGLPLMIPLTLEFPDEKECRDNLHQYLLGRDLLVSIYLKNIYFPAGNWQDFWTGKIIEGNQTKEISWPNEKGGGLFLREGAIIPMGPVMQYRGEKPLDEITLLIFPGEEKSNFELYEDDGTSFEYRNGKFCKTIITAVKKGGTVKIEIGPPEGNFTPEVSEKKWTLQLTAETEPTEVKVNGEICNTYKFDSDKNCLIIEQLCGKSLVIIS